MFPVPATNYQSSFKTHGKERHLRSFDMERAALEKQQQHTADGCNVGWGVLAEDKRNIPLRGIKQAVWKEAHEECK